MEYYQKWLKVVEITTVFGINCNQGTSPFCHVLCLGMHTNVMLRFMVQALQDPPLCSSTSCTFIANHFLYIKLITMRCCSSPSPFRAENYYLIGLLKALRQCKKYYEFIFHAYTFISMEGVTVSLLDLAELFV
jgi:hypothetical protein